MGQKTQVYEYHQTHGNIVDYAGFDLPVWFDGIIPECKSVRNQAGIFDVSHMGRVLVEGPNAESFLNRITTNDVSTLGLGKGQYSLLCNPNGGVIDDLTVFRIGPSKYLVVYNAANRRKDWEWFQKNKESQRVTTTDISDDVAMFAVQGPRAAGLLWTVSAARLEDIERFGTQDANIAGLPCLVTRSGYTGEDGFEIYVWNASLKRPGNALEVWERLLDEGKPSGLRPAGLGARDVLRLEAGMCLYGNDMDETTSPVEAKLNSFVKLDKGDFVGKEAIYDLKDKGPGRVRVGFRMREKGIPRQGQEVFVEDEAVGKITSGTFSPTLNVGIGMGFVKPTYAGLGQRLSVKIRDRSIPAEVVKLPFYQRRSQDKVVVFGKEMGLRDFRTKYGSPAAVT